MNDFTFSDLGRVQWGATLKIALARGFSAGIVLAILMLMTGEAANSGVGTILGVPFFWAIFAIPVALGLRLMAGIPAAFGIPIMEAMMLITSSLLVCIGDPIVYLINRSVPNLFNVTDFGFFNFIPMMFILNPD